MKRLRCCPALGQVRRRPVGYAARWFTFQNARVPPTPSRKWLRRSLVLVVVLALGAALVWWLDRKSVV